MKKHWFTILSFCGCICSLLIAMSFCINLYEEIKSRMVIIEQELCEHNNIRFEENEFGTWFYKVCDDCNDTLKVYHSEVSYLEDRLKFVKKEDEKYIKKGKFYYSNPYYCDTLSLSEQDTVYIVNNGSLWESVDGLNYYKKDTCDTSRTRNVQ